MQSLHLVWIQTVLLHDFWHQLLQIQWLISGLMMQRSSTRKWSESLKQHGTLSLKKKAGTVLVANRAMEVCGLIFGLKQEPYAELAWLMYWANCHVHLVKKHHLKLLVSSGGCLNMEVACVFGTVCITDYFSTLWIENEVMKWRGDKIWYEIVILWVRCSVAYSTEIKYLVVFNTTLFLYVLHFLKLLVAIFILFICALWYSK